MPQVPSIGACLILTISLRPVQSTLPPDTVCSVSTKYGIYQLPKHTRSPPHHPPPSPHHWMLSVILPFAWNTPAPLLPSLFLHQVLLIPEIPAQTSLRGLLQLPASCWLFRHQPSHPSFNTTTIYNTYFIKSRFQHRNETFGN